MRIVALGNLDAPQAREAVLGTDDIDHPPRSYLDAAVRNDSPNLV